MANYATPDDMLARYHHPTLGDLVSRNQTTVNAASLKTDAVLAKALATATGEINASVLRANRYKVTDLEALAALATPGREYLADLTCEVVYWKLLRSKPHLLNDQERAAARDRYREVLQELGNGTTVLDITEAQEAGKPKVRTVGRSEVASTYSLIVDKARGRFFPARRSYRNR